MNPNNLNTKLKYFLVILIILAITLLIYILFYKQEIKISSLDSHTDLKNHRIYSQYDYTLDDNKINIGYQPLYLPTGIIFEVIKRDKILQEALNLLEKEIKFFPYLKGYDLNHFLEQKVIVGGVVGDMPALTAASNFDIIIPVVLQKGNVSIVSDKPMLTNDLKGKRIGYPLGSIAHYFLLNLLLDAGIKENEVNLIPMDVSSMANALYNNKIDLFTAWEPSVAEAMKKHPGFFITFKQISTGYFYFSKEFATKNPEVVNHIIAAVIRAFDWLKSNRANLILASQWNIIAMEKLTGQKSLLNAEEIADLAMTDIFRYISKYSIALSKDDLQENSILNAEFIFLKELNIVPVNSEWDEVSKSFDLNMILDIHKQPKDYNLDEYDYDNTFNEK